MLYSHTIKLVRFYEGADGLKTGHTDAAGYCLAATAKRGDLRLIAIVLGEEDSKVRNSETMNLLDYGFNNVKIKTLKNKGDVVKKIEIDKSDKEIVNVILKENLSVVSENYDTGNYEYKIKIFDIKLPLKVGDIIGEILLIDKNSNIVSRAKLTISENINKLNFFDLYKKCLFNIINGSY